MPLLSRRATLLGLTALIAAAPVKLALADAPGDNRFVVVVLRGALDGMSAVIPYGDANLASLRGPLIPPAPGQPGGMFDLGGFYGLHPALPGLYKSYQAGQLLPLHAIAGPYRTRSHFEAQDLLELGATEPGITSGWLNRALAELPPRPAGPAGLAAGIGPAGLAAGIGPAGLAAGIGTPLILQGAMRVQSYAPAGFAAAPPASLYARIAALNANDPLLGPAMAEGLRTRTFDKSVMSDDTPTAPGDARPGGFAALAAPVGQLLAAPAGPRIAAFQLEGWDTHGNQLHGLNAPLAGLDAGLAALQTALGPAWANTMVLVVTEFGRTAAINGTNGTDHGTATAAFLLGANVAGGRVLATWPGLAPARLFEARDLAPTLDVRSLAKGALAAQFGLSGAALARVFPGSGTAGPLRGLTRAA